MMINKKYTLLGAIILILSVYTFISTLISNLPNLKRGIYGFLIFFAIFTILLIITGGYYFFIGIKNLKVNKIIKYSAITNTIALIIAIIGAIIALVLCNISFSEGFCVIPGISLVFISTIIFFIGFIIMIIGWISKSKRFK